MKSSLPIDRGGGGGMLRIASCAIALLAVLVCRAAHAEGALAIGKDQFGRQWAGWSYNSATLRDARDAAMRGCLQNGSNCNVVATFRGICFALISGRFRNGGGYGWATRPNESDARNVALSDCRARGGYCEVKASLCDTVDEAAIIAQRNFAQQQAEAESRRRKEAEEREEAAARQRRFNEQQAEADARRRRLEAERAAEEASFKAQVKTTQSNAAAFREFFSNPVTQIAVSIGVPIIVIVLKRAVGGESESESVPKRIAVGTATSTLAALLLHTMGITHEIALVSIPIVGGLVLALNYDRAHA